MAAVRSQQDTPSGMLRINAFATGAREILAPLVLNFLRRHGQVHVDLVTEGRIVDIVAEGFDLGIRPLLSPVVLFIGLGALAAFVRSDLTIAESGHQDAPAHNRHGRSRREIASTPETRLDTHGLIVMTSRVGVVREARFQAGFAPPSESRGGVTVGSCG